MWEKEFGREHNTNALHYFHTRHSCVHILSHSLIILRNDNHTTLIDLFVLFLAPQPGRFHSPPPTPPFDDEKLSYMELRHGSVCSCFCMRYC